MTESTPVTSLGNGRFTRIIFRIRPNLANLTGPLQLQAFGHTGIAIYLAPLIIISLIWLVVVTDFSRFAESWPAFIILFAAILLMNRQTFTLEVSSEQGGLSFISSLSNLALWAGILIRLRTVMIHARANRGSTGTVQLPRSFPCPCAPGLGPLIPMTSV